MATFAGGCFWCTEAAFDKTEGVYEAISGYTGGSVVDPTYEQVVTGTTVNYIVVGGLTTKQAHIPRLVRAAD